ncbi:hypothetical protein IFM89_014520 [Coptis chinensis]|uniref:Protein kinase domain-containing protein n=1 Tax=Coptis chinensis TaxID=261450 RepID=A0A835HBP1_9MAGN|nr:hypothetical protein IFM89_014520 [Coptis chinensis]
MGGIRDDRFEAKVETLGKIRHKNIVKFWCCCTTKDSKFLIYEYMPNGSLGDLLHSTKASLPDWLTRYKIAVDVAEGLSYLHHDYVPPIVHRDVKSNNILLDEQFHARVADFGQLGMQQDRIRGPSCPINACGVGRVVLDPCVRSLKRDRIGSACRGPACGGGKEAESRTLVSEASSGIGSADPRVQTACEGQAELSRTLVSEASNKIRSADPRVQTARVGQAELSRTLVSKALSRIGSADPRVQIACVG